MKKLLLTTVILFTFALLQAQIYTFEDFKAVYDSILVKENTFFFTGRHYLRYPKSRHEDSTKNIHWSHRYELERIKYLEPYLLDSFPNVRRVALELIFSIGVNSKNPQVRQRAVNDILYAYYLVIYPDVPTGYLTSFYIPDFNRQAKERIKEIILGKKSQNEIDFMNDYFFKKFLKSGNIEKDARYISQKDSLPYEYVRDSLIKYWKKDYYSPGGYENYFDRHIFLFPGYLYMYDFIPELEGLLEKRLYKSYYWEIKLSLARLGVEKYVREFLVYNPRWGYESTVYSFINTQEAAEFFIKNYINNDTAFIPYFIDDYAPSDDSAMEGTGKNDCKGYPISWLAYSRLQDTYWIKDFPAKYRLSLINTYSDPKTGCRYMKPEDKKKFDKGRRWLNRHIGRFDLNPEWWHLR